ncbi:MAG: glycosyltransferase [bacterium]|nr:glycosyltransferase [bacterium]
MRVALVHEFLTQMGGAERVLAAFHEIFPEAPIYTLVYDPLKTNGFFDSWDIRTSQLQKLPGLPENYKWYLPLMPKAIESINFEKYDLILSDASAFAKGVITKKPTLHICYCHTSTRYLWQDMDGYVSSIPRSSIVKFAVKAYLKHFLKSWDYKAAQRPDFFVANSRTVHDRIKEHYHRDSEVIYPPVDTGLFTSSPPAPLPVGEGGRRPGEGEDYFFTASRLEPYKKIDLVIEAFNQLDLRLKVAGTGSQFLNLKSQIKNPRIELLGRVSDEQLRNLYSNARAFIFPSLEDAGLMVPEALACGTPVLAYGQGGSAEYIKHGGNGVLFQDQTVQSLLSAVKKLPDYKFDPLKLRQSVRHLDREIFKKKIIKFIEEKINAHRN